MQMLYNTSLRVDHVITRLQINNQDLSLTKLLICVPEMQYRDVDNSSPHPSHPQKP